MMYKIKLIEKLRYLKILPGLVMVISILTLISNLVSYEAEMDLLFGVGITSLVSGCIIYFEFSSNSLQDFRICIANLWWGLILGLFTFSVKYYRWWSYDDRDRLTDMLLTTSTLLRCCCIFLDRCAANVVYKSCLVTRSEMSMIFGFFSVGVFFVNAEADMDLFVVCVASTFLISNMRMKCTMAFPYMLLYAAVSGIAVYDNMSHKMNKYALICYHLHLIFPSVSDFYFSPLSAIERWSCTFWHSWCKQLLIIACALITEIIFCLLAYYVIFIHPEFELLIMVPILTFVFIIWVCAHFGFVSSEITLAGKLVECQEFYRKLPTSNSGTDIAHIMSNKGVRQLCMVGQQIVSCALLSTVVFGGLAWRRENATYPAIVLFILGLECLSFGRHRELAVKLGGTCTAYAIIAPTTVANPKSIVTLLPVDSIKKQNDRATSLISSLHRFFAVYLIESLGCEYSTSGTGVGAVDEKIRNLFSKRHNNDSSYDTYMLYYSGLTLADGSLVLAGNGTISPEQIIRTWQETCGSLCRDLSSPSRLLLVLDVADAGPWLRAVSSLRSDFVAVQACRVDCDVIKKLDSGGDPEVGIEQKFEPGDFTPMWCHWNTSSTSSEGWYGESPLRPVYAVSRRWTDFALRSPYNNVKDDFSHAWICRPCLAASTSCSRRLNLVRLLGAPGRRYRRLKMRWFPPGVLDTGHGFKLVRM